MLAVAALSSTPSQGESQGGTGPAPHAPAESLLGRGAGGAKLTPAWQKRACGFSPLGRVGSQTMQKESGFGSFGLICFQCSGMPGCWEGLRSMKKQSQSCREGGLRKRERDGGKRVVGLESRAAVCNGSSLADAAAAVPGHGQGSCLFDREVRQKGGRGCREFARVFPEAKLIIWHHSRFKQSLPQA